MVVTSKKILSHNKGAVLLATSFLCNIVYLKPRQYSEYKSSSLLDLQINPFWRCKNAQCFKDYKHEIKDGE